MVNVGKLFMLAWRILPHVPQRLVRGAFDAAARILHLRNPGSIRQLEKNLHRVTGASGRELRRLSRTAFRRYMLYYAEAFQLSAVTPQQLVARVRTINSTSIRKMLDHQTVVAGLGHVGNWDLAGAWSEGSFAHVVTVAEKLEPEELFVEFLRFRQDLGMEIFAYEKGEGVFEQLVESAKQAPALMPLLADRDLSSSGIEVQICGHPMRVAPGPAAIARAAKVPFIGVFIRHERLRGARRRAAGSPWGIVIEFTDPIEVPGAQVSNEVGVMMQRWADLYSAFLQSYPEDWHMLQRCFMADLDPERLKSSAPGTFG